MTTTLEARFWSKVSKGAPDACWEWQGWRCRGYGQIRESDRRSRALKAHRVSWALHNGSIPDGLVVRHRCDNPGCVNPAHLELGTQADNVRDMVERGRGRGCLGTANGRSKLTFLQVAEIRSSDATSYALSKVYGVSETQITRIRRGQAWRTAT